MEPRYGSCGAAEADGSNSTGSSTAVPPLDRLIAILAALRDPISGCPWDLQQTHDSLAPYAVEEAYELADAIARDDATDIRDELGDCLLQVVFHARVAEERGAFDFADIVETIAAKMLRRHPHVFGGSDGTVAPDGDPESQPRPAAWEAIKAAERSARDGDSLDAAPASGLLADVPIALPGLTRAVKLQARAASVGFDWPDIRQVVAKVREEIEEVEVEVASRDAAALHDEIGDLLFAVGNLARHAGIDPEASLRSANAKFKRRFGHIERALAADGRTPHDATLAEMEALWLEAKAGEQAASASQDD